MKVVSTNKAPQAIGPYSQAIIANGMVFTSGQIALNSNGEIVADDVEGQTKQVITNLSEVLKEAGSSLDKVIKTTTVAVKTLPLNVKVEIDCIAMV